MRVWVADNWCPNTRCAKGGLHFECNLTSKAQVISRKVKITDYFSGRSCYKPYICPVPLPNEFSLSEIRKLIILDKVLFWFGFQRWLWSETWRTAVLFTHWPNCFASMTSRSVMFHLRHFQCLNPLRNMSGGKEYIRWVTAAVALTTVGWLKRWLDGKALKSALLMLEESYYNWQTKLRTIQVRRLFWLLF